MATDPQVAAIAEQLRAAIAAARNELAVEITANLVEATPFELGHARRNWVPSVGAPATAVVDSDAAREAGLIAVMGATMSEDVFTSNNVPYIGPLLGGHSQQAAPGWDVAAIDKATQTIQQRYDGLQIEVTGDGATGRAKIGPRTRGGE